MGERWAMLDGECLDRGLVDVGALLRHHEGERQAPRNRRKKSCATVGIAPVTLCAGTIAESHGNGVADCGRIAKENGQAMRTERLNASRFRAAVQQCPARRRTRPDFEGNKKAA
jgi:hypothetical protein